MMNDHIHYSYYDADSSSFSENVPDGSSAYGNSPYSSEIPQALTVSRRAFGYVCSRCGCPDIERQGSLFFCMNCGMIMPIVSEEYAREASTLSYGKAAGKEVHGNVLPVLLISLIAALIFTAVFFLTVAGAVFSFPILLFFIGTWGLSALILYIWGIFR